MEVVEAAEVPGALRTMGSSPRRPQLVLGTTQRKAGGSPARSRSPPKRPTARRKSSSPERSSSRSRSRSRGNRRSHSRSRSRRRSPSRSRSRGRDGGRHERSPSAGRRRPRSSSRGGHGASPPSSKSSQRRVSNDGKGSLGGSAGATRPVGNDASMHHHRARPAEPRMPLLSLPDAVVPVTSFRQVTTGSPQPAHMLGQAQSSRAAADAAQTHASPMALDQECGAAALLSIARSGSGGGASRGAPARPLVSFGDELEELAGGGDGDGQARGRNARPQGLSASTAQRFQQELAQQRIPVAIPSRVVTSAMPGTGTAAAVPRSAFLELRPLHLQPQQPPGAGQQQFRVVTGVPGLKTTGEDSFRLGGGLLTLTAGRSTSGDDVGHRLRQAPEDGGSPPSTSGRSLGRIVFGEATARCARPYMEDRHCIITCFRPIAPNGQPVIDGIERSLAAVYDGHNGTRAADTAAQRLHKIIAANAALRTHTGEHKAPAAMAAEEAAITQALRQAFRTLDDEILSEARAEGARDGATALMVIRLGDTLYAAHAGDSRAVMSRCGKALRLTEDHKPHLPAERARVEAAGGRIDFQRCWRVIVEPREGRLGSGLAVSRSLGDLDFKEPKRFVECDPDVKRLVPMAGDSLVVLASDGLWDVIGDQEAVDCANAAVKTREGWGSRPANKDDAKAAADALLSMAERRGTADNVTVVIMLLQWD